MAKVNNVTRMLDAHGITYTSFDLPVEKLDALETARLLDVDPAAVYKTIVITRTPDGSPAKGKKPILAVIPGPRRADLKSIAVLLGEKKVWKPAQKQAERLTGLQAGGISPLALINRGFQVVVDSSARALPGIHISAGQRGLNIRLGAGDLVQLTGGRFGDISL